MQAPNLSPLVSEIALKTNWFICVQRFQNLLHWEYIFPLMKSETSFLKFLLVIEICGIYGA